jgi:hypothetical protein
MRRCFASLVTTLLTGAVWAGSVELEPANRFGFSGPEIFPIEQQISQLKSADLDGDGLQDLIVVNNARSKISLLLNQTGRTNEPTTLLEQGRREPNELPPDARFKIQSIASEKRISSMVVADLNHDGKPDIAYYGEPKELIIQYNEGTNRWSTLKRIPIEDGTLDPYALVNGDLNGDGRTDLLLLADAHLYLIAQKQDGTFAEPEKLPYIGTVKSIQVLDIQGDGRDDLLLVNWDNPNPFRFRLQNETGRLGPEIHFTLPPIRSYWADDLDKDRRTEIVTIAQKSGRAQISTFRQKAAEDLVGNWKQGQFQMMPLLKTTRTRRGSLLADLNGDKRSDLLMADPDGGQLSLSLQNEAGGFEAPQSFATLTGITELEAADWDGDGRMEVFMLSNDERQIGWTSLDEKGRLGFPKMLHFDGRPLAMAAGRVGQGDKLRLAAIIDSDGKRQLELRGPDSDKFQQRLSESFKATPASMLVHDVDQDGLSDLVVLIPYEKIKILLQTMDGSFKEVDVAPPGGNTDQPWVSRADVDGDGEEELLLPQRNFLRAVTLKANDGGQWNFEVKEQINGAASNSRIVAAAGIRSGGDGTALFMLDAERKTLTISTRNESGGWEVSRNIRLPYVEFTSVRAIEADGRPVAVSLVGLNSIAWLRLDGEVWELAELDGYETPIKDGYLHDVVSGDLNGDGRRDLVFLETAKSYLDLVTFEPPHRLAPANRWQVFEERTFRSRRNDLAEPREAIIVDLTGDGRNDLAVVVHDRVLVYPQE